MPNQTSPTPFAAAIRALVDGGTAAKSTVGSITFSYTPPTAESPGVLAYGKRGQWPRPNESTAIYNAAKACAQDVTRQKGAIMRDGWHVGRLNLHGLQRPLIPEEQTL